VNISMKIAIIGCPGSGKSTLATKLHNITGIPVYHLDHYFWKPGWQRLDRAEFAKIHHALCDIGDDWIIEGVATRHFDYRTQKADVIIFLDIPFWLCLYRFFKRSITGYGQERDSSAKGCPERMPDWNILSYMWNFNKNRKPGIEVLLQKYKNQKKIFVVKNNAEFDTLVKKFESKNI